LSICCCCKFYVSLSADVVNSVGAVTEKNVKDVEKSAPYPIGCLSENPAPLVVTAEKKEVKQKHQLYVDF